MYRKTFWENKNIEIKVISSKLFRTLSVSFSDKEREASAKLSKVHSNCSIEYFSKLSGKKINNYFFKFWNETKSAGLTKPQSMGPDQHSEQKSLVLEKIS